MASQVANDLTAQAAALLDDVIAIAERMPAKDRTSRAKMLRALTGAYIEVLDRRPALATAPQPPTALGLCDSLRHNGENQ
jgi:hypothetical protein